MGRKEDFMLAHKIDATSKIDVDLVQHGDFGQFLQECEFALRFKEIPWTTAPSWISVHWETKIGLLDFLGLFVLLKKDWCQNQICPPPVYSGYSQWYSATVLSFWGQRFAWETVTAGFYGARAWPLTVKQAVVVHTGFWHHLRKLCDQKSFPQMGCGAACLSQAELPARNPDLTKSNALTLQWPLWLHRAQLRQRSWSLAVTKCFLLLAFYF